MALLNVGADAAAGLPDAVGTVADTTPNTASTAKITCITGCRDGEWGEGMSDVLSDLQWRYIDHATEAARPRGW